jgi:hypothetical protein
MTPEFANAALPLVVYILKLFDRAAAYTTGSAEIERGLLRAEFEATAAKLRGPRAEEWELASYALAAVVDELLIVDIPWTGQSWWENHAFEVELFNTRRRATEFYSKADKAASFQSKEALSMFVLAVLVGFRGVLRDQPEQVETWLRSHIQSVRTAPETAVLPTDGPEMPGAPPLDGTVSLLWQSVATIAAAAIFSVVCWWTFWLV